jgi:hypothetical protein
MTDQNTSTTPNSEYLTAVPPASSFAMDVRQSQIPTVVEMTKTLSPTNPYVTFELSMPLDQVLYDELVGKGYSVTRNSGWTNVNGKCTEKHCVTVALPSTYVRRMFEPRPIFWSPRLSLF